MSKKALVCISFGTSYEDAEKAILQLERALEARFKEYDCFRAFTSGMIIKKIEKTRGIKIYNVAEIMEKLRMEGYEEVLCQSFHVIQAEEYHKTIKELKKYTAYFHSLRLGKPLLSNIEDFKKCAQILGESLPKVGQKEAIVFMGHGSNHMANACYSQMEIMFRQLGYENFYVGTVEGFPGLDYVLKRLEKRKVAKITLTPFMIVAGDHAKNDLAGDEEDSWKSALSKRGYKTELILRGLGELPEIASLFLKHADAAECII